MNRILKLLGLAVLLAAPAALPRPELIPETRWKAMSEWQRGFTVSLVADAGARAKAGIREEKWTALPDAEKREFLLRALERENDSRFGKELDRVQAQMDALQEKRDSNEPITISERERFAHDALNLETEYPGAARVRLSRKQRETLDQIREAGAKYELEAAYLLSHPTDARYAESLQALKAARADPAGRDPVKDKLALDRLFEHSLTGNLLPGPPLVDAGRETGALPPPIDGRRGGEESAVPDTAGIPPEPRIRFEARPPKDSIRRALWKLLGGEGKEKRYFEKVMAGLRTPTERAVLERLARNQQAFEADKPRRIAEFEDAIRESEKIIEKRRAGASPEQLQAAGDHIARLTQARDELKNRSSELVVSMVDEEQGLVGTAGWDERPGSDGKVRLHMHFARRKALSPLIRERRTHTHAMKVFTHEFSHNADQAHPEGMLYGLTERNAYLNAAKAYKEEGAPQGEDGLDEEAEIAEEIQGDPVAWTVEHLTSPEYVEKGSLWSYITTDDVRDPESGLRWRLRLAYDFAVRMNATAPGSRAAAADVIASINKLELGDDVDEELASVYLEPGVPGSDKSRVFADIAAATKTGRDWVERVRGLSEREKERMALAHSHYWRDLADFCLSP